MSMPVRILIMAALGMISFTMAFGTWYALFDEHQTLVGMGTLLASGFMEAAGLAWLLALSSALFPLGVLMQTGPAAGIGQILSVLGSVGVLLGLLVAIWGLLRSSKTTAANPQ